MRQGGTGVPTRIRFGSYELDGEAMELRKNGQLIRLPDQPFQLLAILAERSGEIVTREELQGHIWGDTFVEFDQSLNRAVNRLREALNDQAAKPLYIETVPRRGYRFIAPVTKTSTQAPSAALSPATDTGPSAPAESKTTKSPWKFLVAGLLGAAVIGGVVFVWLRQARQAPLPEPRLIASDGYGAAQSRDGKMLAYSSFAGTGGPQVLLRQTAGELAFPVTNNPGTYFGPDFSPDGTHLVFWEQDTGIYITSTLRGEPRMLVRDPRATMPRYSPSGASILYCLGDKAFTVSSDGGPPVDLPLNRNFHLYGPPLWGPSGNEILFYGIRSNGQNEPARWWVVPLASGQPRAFTLPGIENNYVRSIAIRAWVRSPAGQEWILYSTCDFENWKLWRAGIGADGVIGQSVDLVASGTGRLNYGGSVSDDGNLLYSTASVRATIFQIPITLHGQKLGPSAQIPFPDGGTYISPAVAGDGKRMAYISANYGKRNAVMVRDLTDGVDHLVDDKGRTMQRTDYVVTITPDGSRVIFERDCEHGVLPRDHESALPCTFIDSPSGGDPEQICEHCRPRGFSSDGSVLLTEKLDPADGNKDRIVAVNLRSRTAQPFLSDPTGPISNAYFSQDDRWVVFKKSAGGHIPRSQIFIARVRHGLPAPKGGWIMLTDTTFRDDKPRFSPDGSTVFFTSTRDGYLCVWAQRLDPESKHPVGTPFAVEHFHNSEGHHGTGLQRDLELSVARNFLLLTLPQVRSTVWMTSMQ
jgi:DNA-binding winged helix-turn-helix (wHTH) protein/Tol biopolymer transport system component